MREHTAREGKESGTLVELLQVYPRNAVTPGGFLLPSRLPPPGPCAQVRSFLHALCPSSCAWPGAAPSWALQRCDSCVAGSWRVHWQSLKLPRAAQGRRWLPGHLLACSCWQIAEQTLPEPHRTPLAETQSQHFGSMHPLDGGPGVLHTPCTAVTNNYKTVY